MPRRDSKKVLPVERGCYALNRTSGQIVLVDSVEGDDVRATLLGSTVFGTLTREGSIDCKVQDLSVLEV